MKRTIALFILSAAASLAGCAGPPPQSAQGFCYRELASVSCYNVPHPYRRAGERLGG